MMIHQEAIGQIIGAYDMPQHQKQVHDTFLQFLPTKAMPPHSPAPELPLRHGFAICWQVERVNKGNMKEWMQRDPHKARVLLATNKKTTPPMFTKLSLDHAGGVLFGELRESDAGPHPNSMICSRIKSRPLLSGTCWGRLR